MDQGSNKNHSPAYNFTPTVTKFCVMWEGFSLPHDTKFGNCRCKIVDSRSFHSWSLIHGLRWSGLIKVGPGKRANRAWFRGFCLLAESVCGAPDHRPPVAVTSTTCSCPPKHWGTQAHSYLILSLSHTHTPPLFVICPPYQCVRGRAITYS